MNWQKLFEIQGGLDEHINKEKRIEGQDLLPKKILALQVELGELANEWRGFKFWSKRQFPTNQEVHSIDREGNAYCRNTLLEEYVDGLHFLLSIGLDLNYDYKTIPGFYPTNLVTLFIEVNYKAAELYSFLYVNKFKKSDKCVLDAYQDLFDEYLMIGQQLGFNEKQVVDAYIEKNRINHDRQSNGY